MQLLRRHILQGPGDLALLSDGDGPRRIALRNPCKSLRQTEVQQLDSLLRYQNIRGLQIAVDDAFAVRCVEGVEDLPGVLDGFVHWQRAFERSAVDQFHHQVIRADVVDLADVRMIQRRDGAGLAFKTVREFGLQNFHTDITVQPCVTRFPHFTHAAFTDRRDDFIRAEFCAGLKLHRDGGSIQL